MVTLQYLKPFFENKNVLVTGHTGFKGAWLIQILKRLGAQVSGLALEPLHNHDLYNQIDGETLCSKSVLADIRDDMTVTQTIISAQPDFIFHMAAQPLVIESYQKPLYTFEVNAMGTAYVLQAIQQLGKPCVCICITTDKVYHNPENGLAFTEQNALGGYDPYSASKAAAEIIIQSYRDSFFNPTKYNTHQVSIASVRAGNVIGGGDYAANRLIPDVITAIQNNTTVQLRNPNATRPWQHVLEPLAAYLLLATKLVQQPTQFCKAYNIGPYPKDVLAVKDVVDKAISIIGKGSWQSITSTHQVHEAQNLVLDITQATTQLGWTPMWDVHQSIEHTINWYTNTTDAADVKCQQQINNYFKASINSANDH
jgi:CDP-glucose 4,6-dehydratase